MRSLFPALAALMLPLLPVLPSGCLGAEGGPGIAASCIDAEGRSFSPCRVIRGRLALPLPGELRTEVMAFQVGALAFATPAGPAKGTDSGIASDGSSGSGKLCSTPGARFFAGPPFSQGAGAGYRASVAFSVTVPCTLSVNLLLQFPRGSGSAPGIQAAQMAFAPDSSSSTTTTLVPQQAAATCGQLAAALDLGTTTLVLSRPKELTSGTITLGKGGSKNPLSLLDTDGDGTADLDDTDDDDDGVADTADLDVEGDGILDSAETFEALTDVIPPAAEGKTPGDGVPDMFQ